MIPQGYPLWIGLTTEDSSAPRRHLVIGWREYRGGDINPIVCTAGHDAVAFTWDGPWVVLDAGGSWSR